MADFAVQVLAGGEVRLFEQVVDHALQAHGAAVVGGVDAGDAVVLEVLNLGGQNDAAAAAEEFDVARAPLFEEVVHVLEVLVVAALVAGNGNGLGIFLNGAVHDFLHRAVVAQVDNLRAAALNNAAHDVDGGVVPIKEGGGRDDPDVVFGFIRSYGSLHSEERLGGFLKG